MMVFSLGTRWGRQLTNDRFERCWNIMFYHQWIGNWLHWSRLNKAEGMLRIRGALVSNRGKTGWLNGFESYYLVGGLFFIGAISTNQFSNCLAHSKTWAPRHGTSLRWRSFVESGGGLSKHQRWPGNEACCLLGPCSTAWWYGYRSSS